jgi:hypothetical protein
VLEGIVNGQKTLTIAFEGSTSNDNRFLDGPNPILQWQKYQPLIDVIHSYVSDPLHGITQVLFTGHSLGGSMVNYAMNEGLPNAEGFTWGSPGAKITPSNTNIVNFEHLSDVVPLVGRIVGNYLVGSEVVINDWANNAGLFAQHDMTVYQLDTANLIDDARSLINPFHNTSLAGSLRAGVPWASSSKMQISVGSAANDSLSISANDSFVFGSGGNDVIKLSPTVPSTPMVIDGGSGTDTLVLPGLQSLWSWKAVGSHAPETDLFFNGVEVAKLIGIEQLEFGSRVIHL